MISLVASTVGCDAATKRLALEHLAGLPAQSFFADTVRLSYTENPGGFLSIGATLPGPARTALFAVATGILLAALAVAAWRSGWRRWQTIALVFFSAGGFANWMDRLDDGRVVDFLNVGLGAFRTGVFNVADVAIMLGVSLFFFAETNTLRGDSQRP